MTIKFEPIGYVSNSVTEQMDVDWGKVETKIILNPEFSKGLTGLTDFSHINVIYYLDKAKYIEEKHLIRRPQGREDMPMVGIFSQRVKDRPNPIGITSVNLLSIKDNIITVKGLDAIDGTPILDIKPYYPVFDKRDNAVVPEWVNILMREYF